MPSFYIDLQSGRGQSEVDYLNGAVVRFGERLNIPTPVNRWLTLTLQQLTQNKIPVGEYSHRPTKYLDQINTYLLK
jgi:2-dehydropantoate 2-reductase